MQLSKNKLLLILVTLLFNQKNFTMGASHIWSAEMEEPRTSIETPKIKTIKNIHTPLSLKILSTLALVKNEFRLPTILPLELREYVLQFIKMWCFQIDNRVCTCTVALNRAIQDNKYEMIPDLIGIMKKFDPIDLILNQSTGLPKQCTPLVFAIEKENLTLAHTLLAEGANPNIPWAYNSESPLILAVKKGNTDLVELLIQYNADIEQTNKINGSTPLIEAARRGEKDIVKILLKKGANKNRKDGNGCYAASLAKSNGHQKVYELLSTPAIHL